MYSTEGVVLKRIDIAEADQLFSIYTKEFGKIRARAQGIKKEEAKLKGHLEPLSKSVISFVLGKTGERLTHALLAEFWPGMRTDLPKYAAARYIAELFDEQCFVGQSDAALWKLLLDSFESLERGDPIKNVLEAIPAFVNNFEIQFLGCLGYNGEQDIRVLGTRIVNPFLCPNSKN